MRKTYKISLDGCDDTTEVEMELDEKQLDVLSKLKMLVNARATAYCQPEMRIEELKQEQET